MSRAMEELLEQEYPDYFTAENIDKMAAEEKLFKKRGKEQNGKSKKTI